MRLPNYLIKPVNAKLKNHAIIGSFPHHTFQNQTTFAPNPNEQAMKKEATKLQRVAILAGGNVAEREISLLSAATIYRHLDRSRYEPYVVELNGNDFVEQQTRAVLDKNDFSFELNGERIRFDLVFPYIHGHPVEDGQIQGYFKLLGIPCTGCDTFVSALTFNKQACKNYLAGYPVALAPSVVLRAGSTLNRAALETMDLPLFVKPNKNGSSYGVTKVKERAALHEAIERAFQFDDEVIVEGFLDGREFSNGVVRRDGEIVVLPITEIIPEAEYFDYQAKYEGRSREITPADLSIEETERCQSLSRYLYELLDCRGMVRFDYILTKGDFYLLEPNTTPGFSPASLIPQQAAAHGWTLTELLNAAISDLRD